MSVSSFCDWISATAVSQVIQSVAWIIPVVQSIHILAIAVVMSGALLIHLRIIGVLGRRDELLVCMHRYLPWTWGALLVLLVSGLMLVVGEPKRELLNPVFWLKMSLLAGTLLITLAIQRPLSRDESFWESGLRRSAVHVLAATALVAWVGIVCCGRWIAYTYEP